MYNRMCDLCKSYNGGNNHVLRLTDDKEQLDINGHRECIDHLYDRVLEIPHEKLTNSKLIEKLGIKL